MTRQETGFGTWVLCGPRIEAERQRIRDLIYPPVSEKKDPRTGRPVPPPTPDYGPNDQYWYSLRILDEGALHGRQGFNMDQFVKHYDPDELATVKTVLANLDEIYSSQDLENT